MPKDGPRAAIPERINNVLTQQNVEILAHHGLLLAIPAFVPAIAVIGVIAFVALRDRRGGQPESELASSDSNESE